MNPPAAVPTPAPGLPPPPVDGCPPPAPAAAPPLAAAPAPAAPAVADQALTALLRAHHIKLSLPRLQVVRALHDHAPDDGCMSPDDICRAIYKEGGRIAVAPIYSALALLTDAGLVDRYRLGDGPAVYCLRRGQRWSAFLVCNHCQRAQGIRDQPLEAQLGSLAQSRHFRLHEHNVVLRGLCPPCAAQAARLS